jgi:hypothetical protein
VRAWIGEVADLTDQAPAATAAALLAAMRDLMSLELRRIQFTEGEADCLVDILNGRAETLGLGPLVYAVVSDAVHLARADESSSYAARYGIDEDTLLSKLRGMGPTADLALRLAVARWWAGAEPRDYATAALNIRLPDHRSQTPSIQEHL